VRIPVPIPFPAGHVNAYLLRGAPLTLVDCGPCWPPALEALEDALAVEGVELADIELLIVTHQHEDHAGLAETVRARSGCTVAAHDVAAALLLDERATRAADDAYAMELLRLHGAPPDVIDAVPGIAAAAEQYSSSIEVTRRLSDDDVIVAGGEELRVALRPGHSPSDTIFFGTDGRALIADHLLRDGPVVTVAHRPPNGPDDPRLRPPALLQYRESLEQTAGLGLTLAFPGHGEQIEEPNNVIAQRLVLQDRRAERILAEFGDGRRTAWDIIDSIWSDRQMRAEDHPISIQFVVLSDILGHVDLLVESGKVKLCDDGVRISFEVSAS
jgi:glyoxylase-like metal-dependent hydrolase (beta-lactamase superfamily II)